MAVSKYGFQPGNKLGGRTAEGERIRKACRKVTERVVQAWIDALDAVDDSGGPDHDVRMKAANYLADRGYGKPAQAVTGEDGGAIKVDTSSGLFDALKRLAGE